MNDELKRLWKQGVDDHHEVVWEHFNSQSEGQKVWVTMLYGSQNYGLGTAESDVDTKSMVFPSLLSLSKNRKPVSIELTMPDGSLDTTKDLREMFANYLKSNINFLETLYTSYYRLGFLKYGDFFKELREHRDLIANCHPRTTIHMAAAMAEQKYHSFNKPFVGKKEVLSKYGYDPKQLHHQVRLYYFIKTFMETGEFHRALDSCNPEINPKLGQEVLSLKTSPISYQLADALREDMRALIQEMDKDAATSIPRENKFDEAKEFLDDLSYRIICFVLKEELEGRV